MAVGSRVALAFRRIGGGLSQFWGALRGLSVVLAGVGLLGLLAALPLYLLVPELSSYALALAALGVFLMLLALLTALGQVRTALVGRHGRYGSNTVLMVIAFLGVMVVANLLGVRQSYRLDLTVNQQLTLAPQTAKVLKELTIPVHTVGFFVAGDPDQEAGRNVAESVLREYTRDTPKFTYEFVDPILRPTIARQYEVTSYGTIVFTSEKGRASVEALTTVDLPGGERRTAPNPVMEQDFTAALLKVTGKQQLVIYYLIGHDEPKLDSQDVQGFSIARGTLERDLYRVAPLSLDVIEEVPKDAAAVIIIGPKKPLPEADRSALESYLKGGGNLVFLGEPALSPGWADLWARWGLRFSGRPVVEEQRFVQPDKKMPAAWETQYQFLTPQGLVSHPIVQVLDVTFFPGAAALTVDLPEDQRDIVAFPLIRTTAQSRLDGSEGDTDRGPFFLGMVLEGQPLGTKAPEGQKRARVAVFGDSDYASNAYFTSRSNGDLFVNSVNWATAREELISIRPKPYPSRSLIVTERAWRWILYSSIGFLPLLVAVVGAFTWWRRR